MLLRDYLEIVRRRIWIVVVCTLLVPTLWVGLDARTDVEYEATAAVLASPSPRASGALVEDLVRSQDLVSSYADLVTRRPVMDAVIADGRVELSADELIGSTRASVVPETSVIEVTVTTPDPDLSVEAANAIAEVFVTVAPELTRSEVVTLSPVEPAVGSTELGPSYVRDIVLGLLFGLLLGLMAAFALNEIDTRPRTRRDLQQRFPDLPVLTTVPKLTRAQRGRLLTSHEPAFESFAVLRSAVASVMTDHLQALVVTSPAAGEGKTTVASNLAAALSDRRRVLLVDADLRRPGTIDRVTVTDSITADGWEGSSTTNPDLIVCRPQSGGKVDANRLAGMLGDLRRHGEALILDAPPVLPVADSDDLARAADGVILVVDSGSTREQAIEDALERLARTGTPVVGFVLNRAPSEPGYHQHYS